jgi:zinc finger protein
MSTNCDRYGYRDNEVKSGSAISEKGKRITLRVEDREDLSRDILKVRMRWRVRTFHVFGI